MGIETEFGVTCTFHGHRRLSPDEVAATCSAGWSPGAAAPTSFCATAHGWRPTWGATPNTPPPSATTSPSPVTHDRAGERVLEDLLIDAEQRLADEGIGGDIYLFKNNTDSAGNPTAATRTT